MSIVAPSKKAFLEAWPGGYGENWSVYGKLSGVSEDQLVSKTLSPFFNKEHVAMEIGCGIGFWVNKYLCPNFQSVVGLDLLPLVNSEHPNFRYIEVPDRNYDCFGVEDDSIDFCWSFGCFCHIPIDCIQKYLNSIFRKLKRGGSASLYFSNMERRPGVCSVHNNEDQIIWVENDMETTIRMMESAGFTCVTDLMPELFDSMVHGKK